MAKMLKQLVFGQKKNPPAPPRPDYDGDKLSEAHFESQADVPFSDHDYENLPKFQGKGRSQVHFSEKKEPELVVFDNYSEPADLRAELSALEADPLYISPLDDSGVAPPQPMWTGEEEEMYCVPYDTPEDETSPPLPQPCLVQGYISHKLGRKAVLMYISAFYIISWLFIAYAPILTYVYVGRIVSGFCAGICAVAVPAYVVEISTVEIRGFLSAGFQVAFAFGVFLVMSFGIFLRWSWLAVTGAVVVVMGACLMLFMPESPLWLIRTSRNTEAIKGLKFLKGKHHDAVAEFKEIVEQLSDEPQTGITWRELLEPALYKPICIAVALMFFQQFSGINALMSYSVEIFQTTKSFLNPAVAATIIALVQLLMTASSSLLMDRAGRRALYITSGICMAVSLIALGVYSYFSVKHEIAVHWNWVPLVCFALYIASFSLGLGPIPFVVTPEMVPTRSRSFLLALACVCCSFFGFVVTKVFDNMRSAVGVAGLYWTYGAFAFLGSVFYWMFIPETKGLTIHEIHASFSSKGSVSK